MSILLADDTFGVLASNTAAQNDAPLQAAVTAACNDHTQLILPAGRVAYGVTPTLPAGFTGGLTIGGLGAFATTLCPVGTADGLNFDFSITNPRLNSLEAWNFSIDTTGTTGVPWNFSWGKAGVPSISSRVLCRLSGIYCFGPQGAVLTECWNGFFQDLTFFGPEPSYGVGPCLSIVGGVNNTFNSLRAAFFAQGPIAKSQRGAGGDPQGIYFNDLSMVECVEGFHGYGTPGGNLSSISFGGYLMIDNGNLNVAGHRGIVLDNAEDCVIGPGQILQDGGDSCVIFNNCKRCSISDDLDLSNRSNTTGPAVQDNNGSGNNLGQNPPSASQLVNISTRGFVGTGGNIMIAGFVIQGNTPKTVLVRASGPALAAFGVPGCLPDPSVRLTTAGGALVAQNTAWGGSAQIASAAASVGAFSWVNPKSADSALLVTLQPGNYTANVSGASGDTGDCLLEVYAMP